jgi:hypothetical protein
MPEQDPSLIWSKISRLVDNALGLSVLADYRCADSICSPAEREAAQAAIAGAIHNLLKQAAELLPQLEPNSRKESA